MTLSAPPAGGTQAIGAVAGGFGVGSVNVTTAGAGYAEAPTISFTGGGGGAAGTAVMLNSRVDGVTITTRGAATRLPQP